MPNNQRLCCALVQMNSADDWQLNLSVATTFIKEASGLGAKLIVLPENFLCFGQKALSHFAPYVESALSSLQVLSDELDCVLVCGSVPVLESEHEDQIDDNARYFSRCYVLRPNQASSYYDKIHLFDVDVNDDVGSYRESDTYCAGSTPVGCEVLDLILGLSICYDLRFPELYQKYAALGASLISVPSAFTYETGKLHWEVLLKARAIETQSYVLAANQCGEHHKGRRTWGGSMIIDPTGAILVQMAHEPGVSIATLDLSLITRVRSAMPLQAHKRLT